jgi:hypothetical protein
LFGRAGIDDEGQQVRAHPRVVQQRVALGRGTAGGDDAIRTLYICSVVVRAVVVLLGLSMGFLLAGCQTLGPAALGAGRAAYNDVIARTSSEQTLGLLVRLRYSDPIGLLTVSSVTAGLKFSAEATGQAGFGPRANYAGNLVPFSAGVGYEDSPTISYTPVDGQAFLREWLAPVTLETLALVMQAAMRQDALIVLLVERMNGLHNSASATAEERPRNTTRTRRARHLKNDDDCGSPQDR